jgi:hypothetical protein
MDGINSTVTGHRHAWKRVLAAAGLMVAFGVMASVIRPQFAPAGHDSLLRSYEEEDGGRAAQPPARSGDAAPGEAWRRQSAAARPRVAQPGVLVPQYGGGGDSTDPHEGLIPLGEICGGEYIVRIFAGDEEPLYSIFTEGGLELGALMTAAEIESWFDDPSLTDLIAAEHLMLVDDPGLY